MIKLETSRTSESLARETIFKLKRLFAYKNVPKTSNKNTNNVKSKEQGRLFFLKRTNTFWTREVY
jgi:hypothetical protein